MHIVYVWVCIIIILSSYKVHAVLGCSSGLLILRDCGAIVATTCNTTVDRPRQQRRRESTLQYNRSSRLAYSQTLLPEDSDFRPCIVFPLQCSLCFLHTLSLHDRTNGSMAICSHACWELLLSPHVTQTADFGHLASFS